MLLRGPLAPLLARHLCCCSPLVEQQGRVSSAYHLPCCLRMVSSILGSAPSMPGGMEVTPHAGPAAGPAVDDGGGEGAV